MVIRNCAAEFSLVERDTVRIQVQVGGYFAWKFGWTWHDTVCSKFEDRTIKRGHRGAYVTTILVLVCPQYIFAWHNALVIDTDQG